MDFAFCVYNTKTEILEYSGAFNPLIIIRNNEILSFKPDKNPIGEITRNFQGYTNQEIKIEKGDVAYVFSDGYQDQFGHKNGRKLLPKNFKEILLRIHQKPAEKQSEMLHEIFEEWKGDMEQIDDVLVFGIKF